MVNEKIFFRLRVEKRGDGPYAYINSYLHKRSNIILSFMLLIILALLANRLAAWSPKALEYPLWAAILGLLANFVMSLLQVKERLGHAFRTELFLKIGLVLLGAGINLTQVLSVGAKGVIQALIMVTSVFFFTWWLGGVFGMDRKLRAVMSTAVSICGVSAAIAAAGSVLAKKEHLAYITALVIVTALPLMVIMPYIAGALHMSPEWAGAWFGGNIDTTAAVVGAGTIYGETAVAVASIVKMTQNVFIGIAAFFLAFYWVLVRNWAFTLAFIGIGWDLSFGELRKMGVTPLVVYLLATIFNTLLAFGVSWILFG